MTGKKNCNTEAVALEKLISCDFFKLLSEPIRLRIIALLAAKGPCDVGTVAEAFPQDRSVISRHLVQLKRRGLVHSEKQARNVIYTFDGFAFLKNIEDVADTVRSMLASSCQEYAEELKEKIE